MEPVYGKVTICPQKLEAKMPESSACEVKLTRTKEERISDAKLADLFILIHRNR